MKVYGHAISDEKALMHFDLNDYVRKLGIGNGLGAFMDTLQKIPHHKECGIVNLNTSHQPGSHRVCYFKDLQHRIYLSYLVK